MAKTTLGGIGVPFGNGIGDGKLEWQKNGKKIANPRVFAIFLLFLQFGGLQRFAIFLPFQNFGCFGCQTVCHSFAILDFEDESTPQGMPGRVFALCGRLVLGIPGSRATA